MTNTTPQMRRTAPRNIESRYPAIPTSTHVAVIDPQISIEDDSVSAITSAHVDYSEVYAINHLVESDLDLLQQKSTWVDREYREAYADAAVEQGVAWQVKINREGRHWTQAMLARLVGTQQSAISRVEDPEYGSYSLPMLQKIAHAFDCALIIKLAPYSILARESVSLSPDMLFAKGYTEEIREVDDYGQYKEK